MEEERHDDDVQMDCGDNNNYYYNNNNNTVGQMSLGSTGMKDVVLTSSLSHDNGSVNSREQALELCGGAGGAATKTFNSEVSKRSLMSRESWEGVASLSSYPLPRCDSPFRNQSNNHARKIATINAPPPPLPPGSTIYFQNNRATETVGSNLSSVAGDHGLMSSLTIGSFQANNLTVDGDEQRADLSKKMPPLMELFIPPENGNAQRP